MVVSISCGQADHVALPFRFTLGGDDGRHGAATAGPARALAAHHVSHRRIDAQPLGVVGVFVTGQATVDRLALQADRRVPRVLAGAPFADALARRICQIECLVEVVIRQQTRIAGYLCAVDLQLQDTVKTHP